MNGIPRLQLSILLEKDGEITEADVQSVVNSG